MQDFIRDIIKEEIYKIILEEDEPKPTDPSLVSGDTNISQSSPGLNPPMPDAQSPGAPPGGPGTTPASDTTQQSDPNSASPDEAGSVPMATQMPGSGPVSSMSGGGFGGGGGGGMSSLDSSQSPADSQDMSSSPLDEPMPGEENDDNADPEQEMKQKALEITEKTKDVQKALKVIKSIIQSKYKDPSEAVGFIQTLVDENPKLKPLARRLASYLLGK